MSSPAGSLSLSSGSKRHHKPRHARMKSSPDELLHLHARLDTSDEETDLIGAMEPEFRRPGSGTGPLGGGPMASASAGLSLPRATPPAPPTLPATTATTTDTVSLGATPTASAETCPPSATVPAASRNVGGAGDDNSDGDDDGMIVHEDEDDGDVAADGAGTAAGDPAVGQVGALSPADAPSGGAEFRLGAPRAGDKAPEASAGADASSPSDTSRVGSDSQGDAANDGGGGGGGGVGGGAAAASTTPDASPADSPGASRGPQASPPPAHMRSMSVDYIPF
jgi:hypothetical protein